MNLSVQDLPRATSAPPVPFSTFVVDILAIEKVLMALEERHGPGPDRDLDGDIYEALGWQVERCPARRRAFAWLRRHHFAWRCRSPLSGHWDVLPQPTWSLSDAAALVPFRWSWMAGLRDGHPHAWVREHARRPNGPLWYECHGINPARALTRAALFAQRALALEAAGHG